MAHPSTAWRRVKPRRKPYKKVIAGSCWLKVESIGNHQLVIFGSWLFNRLAIIGIGGNWLARLKKSTIGIRLWLHQWLWLFGCLP